MKTIFKLVLFVVVAAFYSCGKDENVPSVESSITSGGVISGTIVNYGTNPVESVSFFNGGDGIVSKEGKFSFKLAIPNKWDMDRIDDALNGVDISDPNALWIKENMLSGKNNDIIKFLVMKTNAGSLSAQGVVGYSESSFIYADRDVTLKGTETFIEGIWFVVWDVKLKKGWNEIVSKLEKRSTTSVTFHNSNTITSDLKWRCQ